LWEAAKGAADLAAAVEDLDCGRGLGWGVGCFADLGYVSLFFEHAEGGAEGEVADDVEGQVVEPVEGVNGGVAVVGFGVRSSFGELVPFRVKELEVGVDVGLELADTFRAEGVRDNFAFAGVLGAITGVEEAASDADEGIVVFSVLC
jgi:hypothetical protein